MVALVVKMLIFHSSNLLYDPDRGFGIGCSNPFNTGETLPLVMSVISFHPSQCLALVN